jgi:hypothetical protein
MHHLSKDMHDAIDLCQRCAETCFSTAMTHCLEKGGRHVEQRHFALMIACTEICKTAASVMMTGLEEHRAVCRACAEICEACAKSCKGLESMEDCEKICRQCAESCRAMSGRAAKAA